MTTKRKNPKKVPQTSSTIDSNTPPVPVEAVKTKSKAKVARKPKVDAIKAQAKQSKPKPPSDAVAVKTEVIGVDPATGKDCTAVVEKPMSKKDKLYAWFVGWLYQVTFPFRGY